MSIFYIPHINFNHSQRNTPLFSTQVQLQRLQNKRVKRASLQGATITRASLISIDWRERVILAGGRFHFGMFQNSRSGMESYWNQYSNFTCTCKLLMVREGTFLILGHKILTKGQLRCHSISNTWFYDADGFAQTLPNIISRS